MAEYVRDRRERGLIQIGAFFLILDIPMLMDQIDQHGGLPNFKGAAIGDGCWGNEVGLCAFDSGKAQQIQVEFFGGHAMYLLIESPDTETGD